MNMQNLADKWGVTYACAWHRIKMLKLDIKNKSFNDIDMVYSNHIAKRKLCWTAKKQDGSYLFRSARTKAEVVVLGDDIEPMLKAMALVVSSYYRNKLKEIK